MELKQRTLAILAALSQETRLDMFRIIVQAGADGISAGEISSELEIPTPTCSFHLKELRTAGTVHSQRVSRSIVYHANFTELSAALGYILENCCQGQAGKIEGLT